MIICVDLDDVINDLLPAWLSWLNNRYNRAVAIENVVEWDMTKAYPDLTEKQIFEPLMIEDFWDTVKIKPGAIDVLKQLQKEGHNIYICTSTHLDTIKCKYNKLILPCLPFIDDRHIILTHNKQMIKCDVLIDDNANNLSGGEYIGILYDAPYNRKSNVNNVIRVKNWDEIYNVICEISDRVIEK